MPLFTKMLALAGLCCATTAVARPAVAADFQVKQLNSGAAGAMVFEPALTRVKPGDTVHFVPADKGHDVETIPGMLPAGATPLKSGYSQPYDVTFTTPGVYGLRCGPHYAMGMVGVVVVGGKPTNLAEAQGVTQPGLAKGRMQAILAQVAALPESTPTSKTVGKTRKHKSKAA